MEMVRDFLGTESEVFFCPLPGVVGLEVAVVNSFSPGDTVAVLVFGETGERWAAIAEAFGLSVIRLGGYGGEAPSPEDLRLLFWTREKGAIQGVLVPHVERTSGLWIDLEAFGAVCRSFGSLFIAEVGESFGVFPLELDAFGVDLAVVSDPLSFQDTVFLAVGKRAWEAWRYARCPRFALDFSRIRTLVRELPQALKERLELLRSMGRERVWEERRRLAELFRQEVQALGFGIPGEHLFPSVTVIELPGEIEGEVVLSALGREGVLAGRTPWKKQALWVRHGDALEVSEIQRILGILQRFVVGEGKDTSAMGVDGG